MPDTAAPDDGISHWDRLLQPAARLQQEIRGSTLVGGGTAAFWAAHRYPFGADHFLPDLQGRFEDVLAHLEQLEGWRTAIHRPPV